MKSSKNENEIEYVNALSRPETINAYSNWNALSETENTFLNKYVNTNSKIIDLGCGTGRIVKTLNPKVDNYVGIDCSQQMIEAAIRLNPNHIFICDDILNVNSDFGTYDIVLLMNNVVDMLNPYERRINLFELCKKLLKQNGILIYSSHLLSTGINSGYYFEDYHGANVNTFRALFSQHCSEIENFGFEITMASRDYRAEKADWMYLAAKK